MEITYSLDRKQLVETTTMSFFESMLQMDVWPIPESAAPLNVHVCTARVCMMCQPALEVYLHLTEEQAFHFTERLMQIPRPGSMDEDVRDTMREIVNVIGGNLKASLAEGKQLSIAEVLNDIPTLVSYNASQIFAFESEIGVFWIALAASPNALDGISHQEDALVAF